MSDERDALARSLPEIIKRLGFGGAATVLWTVVLCCAMAYMDPKTFQHRWWWLYGTWLFLAGSWLIGWLIVWRKELKDEGDEKPPAPGLHPVIPKPGDPEAAVACRPPAPSAGSTPVLP